MQQDKIIDNAHEIKQEQTRRSQPQDTVRTRAHSQPVPATIRFAHAPLDAAAAAVHRHPQPTDHVDVAHQSWLDGEAHQHNLHTLTDEFALHAEATWTWTHHRSTCDRSATCTCPRVLCFTVADVLPEYLRISAVVSSQWWQIICVRSFNPNPAALRNDAYRLDVGVRDADLVAWRNSHPLYLIGGVQVYDRRSASFPGLLFPSGRFDLNHPHGEELRPHRHAYDPPVRSGSNIDVSETERRWKRNIKLKERVAEFHKELDRSPLPPAQLLNMEEPGFLLSIVQM